MRRAPSAVILAAIAVAVIGLAGCGEKSEPDLSSAPPPTQPEPPQQQLPIGDHLDRLAGNGATKPGPIAGRWRGTLHQKGLKPFAVRVEIASLTNPRRNAVRYAGIDCEGSWRFLGGRGDAVRFEEVIDRGSDGQCKGRGVVTLRSADARPRRLAYEFTGGGVRSQGVLRRG
jgi:hypothetical protein